MNIQIEGCAYVRMSENDTYSFIVAPAFYASCGEGMSQGMEFHVGYSKKIGNLLEMYPVQPRFYGFVELLKT